MSYIFKIKKKWKLGKEERRLAEWHGYHSLERKEGN